MPSAKRPARRLLRGSSARHRHALELPSEVHDSAVCTGDDRSDRAADVRIPRRHAACARADGREPASRLSADRCELTREVDDLPVRAGNRDCDVAVDLRRPRRCPMAGQVDCCDTLALLFADCREGTRRVENATRRCGQGRDRATRRKSPSDLAPSRVEREKHRPGLLPRAGEVAGDIEQRRAGDRPERTRRPAQAQPEWEQAAGPSVKRSKPMSELAGDLRELTADDQRVPSKRESRNRSSAGRRLPIPVDRTIAPKTREPSTRDAADAAKVARDIPTAAAVRHCELDIAVHNRPGPTDDARGRELDPRTRVRTEQIELTAQIDRSRRRSDRVDRSVGDPVPGGRSGKLSEASRGCHHHARRSRCRRDCEAHPHCDPPRSTRSSESLRGSRRSYKSYAAAA